MCCSLSTRSRPVFGITTNAYLVLACNAFALMGLKQLYVLLARVLNRIVYLNKGLGIIWPSSASSCAEACTAPGRMGAEDPGLAVDDLVAAVLLVTVTAGC